MRAFMKKVFSPSVCVCVAARSCFNRVVSLAFSSSVVVFELEDEDDGELGIYLCGEDGEARGEENRAM